MPSTCRPKPQRSRCFSKCLRPGPVGRNPYLNFLRDFRKNCCGLSPVQTIQQGAKIWNQMTREERLRYVNEAFYARKRARGKKADLMKCLRPRMSSKRSRRSSRHVRRRSGSKRRSGRSHSIRRRARSSTMCN